MVSPQSACRTLWLHPVRPSAPAFVAERCHRSPVVPVDGCHRGSSIDASSAGVVGSFSESFDWDRRAPESSTVTMLMSSAPMPMIDSSHESSSASQSRRLSSPIFIGGQQDCGSVRMPPDKCTGGVRRLRVIAVRWIRCLIRLQLHGHSRRGSLPQESPQHSAGFVAFMLASSGSTNHCRDCPTAPARHDVVIRVCGESNRACRSHTFAI